MVRRMATESFSRPKVIRTNAQAEALIAAYEASFTQEPIKRIDIDEELRRGEEIIKKRYSAEKDP